MPASGACSGHTLGKRGEDPEAPTALATCALGHLGDQKDRLKANRHRQELPKAPPLPADLAALAPATNQQLRFNQQKKPDTSICILGPPILVAFTNTKRMINQALTHAPKLAPTRQSRQELFG